MNYRILPREEWDKLTPIYASMGGVAPTQDVYARVVVATDEERIVGNSSLQTVLCIEATRIDPAYSGRVGFRAMHKTLIASLPHGMPYFAFAIDQKMARICEFVHMKKTDWTVYQGVS
jgi:hypothetical protein